MTDYRSRIQIPHDGDELMKLFTKSGEHIATGYCRIVFGGRGPYMEFKKSHIVKDSIYLPKDLEWKMDKQYADKIFYYEFRTKQDFVKVYFQKHTVDYADYKIHKFYITPFDLYDADGNVIIKKIRKSS